jgi:hypothetical protein
LRNDGASVGMSDQKDWALLGIDGTGDGCGIVG